MTPATLPPLARALSRFIPAADRQAIVGDLLEDAGWRGLRGGRLTLSLCASCGAIAAGLAVESGHMLRGLTARAFVARAVMFGAGVTLLAYGVELLVAVLMAAGGLR